MRLVLDTNVVLDLLHFRDAAAQPILEALHAGTARCFCDARCRAELARVLRYAQFGLDEETAARIEAEYAALAVPADGAPQEGGPPVPPLPPLPPCRDPDDQKFLELARAIGADLLVTKDKDLLRLARSRRLAGLAIVAPPAAALRLRRS